MCIVPLQNNFIAAPENGPIYTIVLRTEGAESYE